MSLSPAQVRIIANSGLFDDAIRAALDSIARISPDLWRAAEALEAHCAQQRQALARHRARTVTRRKQRNRW